MFSPEFLNCLTPGKTQHLDKLNKLQSYIITDTGPIIFGQVVQDLKNLPEKDTFSRFNLNPALR